MVLNLHKEYSLKFARVTWESLAPQAQFPNTLLTTPQTTTQVYASAIPTTTCFANGLVRSLAATNAVHLHLTTAATAITLASLGSLASFFQL